MRVIIRGPPWSADGRGSNGDCLVFETDDSRIVGAGARETAIRRVQTRTFLVPSAESAWRRSTRSVMRTDSV